MPSNWTTVTESKYPWERDALDFVRQRFPAHEPYRAWSNFEFIAEDGSINEVDLLLFTPQGLFLIEIKSHPGRLKGDAGTWTWEGEGKLATMDNPLLLANLKAKKLRSLLQSQRVAQRKGQIPYIEALVFCSAPDLRCDLQGTALSHVCLRDRDATADTPARPGILAAVTRRECPGLSHLSKSLDRPASRLVGQAMEQAAIRPSQRQQRVGDYVLEQLIGEGPGYQDWRATHVQLPEAKRRIRLYLVRAGATEDERKTLGRAALREFQLLEMLQHPGILRAHGFTEHELGPALVFEHHPLSMRLDHYMAQQQAQLSVDTRLDLMRQIAEVVRYAHDKKVVHRALSPQSILVVDPTSDAPRIKIFNWQAGYRTGSGSSGISRAVSATSHVDRLVEDASTAYIAPEALSDGGSTGEHLDVFSLGAIAYYVFSGQPPAANGLELNDKLRETKGLQISSVLNGAGTALQELIQYSTHPEVSNRIDSAVDLLGWLDTVEEELTTPEHEYVEDPLQAKMGDKLPGGFQVVRRIGLGACSVALLVERAGQDFVLKVANDPEHNQRLKDEAQVLTKLHHTNLVQHVETLEIGDRTAFAMRPVFANKTEKQIETLGQRIRKEGHLLIDLLQRFGEDLLDAVNYLEDQGLPHRDIKPDNIAVGMLGRGDRLHLVLFDFSLSRTPPENIRAGTTGYLDPTLPERTPKPPRWDLHAERYAAAVTLYEMATGNMPKWGDGVSDPSHLQCEATIDAEVFEANLRDRLTKFFTRALRRDPTKRFDNAEEMLREWRECFQTIEEPAPLSDHSDEAQLPDLLTEATEDTPVSDLGLGTRATNALDRANVLTVEDLLSTPMRRLSRLRGVGNKTRREIIAAVKILRKRLNRPAGAKSPVVEEPEAPPHTADVSTLGVDQLAQRVLRIRGREGETAKESLHALLGLDPQVADPWPSQSDVARRVNVTRARVGQLLGNFQERWAKDPAITKVREWLADVLSVQGGVASVGELVEALLVERGCSEDEPKRTQLSGAVIRAAVEVERTRSEPRYLVRREENNVLIAHNQPLAEYAASLGNVADELAQQDPLAAPARVTQRLREVSAPNGVALSDARLVRLAVAASCNTALSSRQELYPRGMPAGRVLTLSQGALLGPKQLTVEEIRERVKSRYPNAAPLPDRPALDDLLRDAGFDFRWDPLGRNGHGCYESRLRDSISVTSGSESFPRLPTSPGRMEVGEVTPEEADARQFEERLHRAVKEGSFLTLMVDPKYYERASKELCRRFSVQLVELEGLFLDALRDVAKDANVDWDLVVRTDARPGAGDWDKLILLVGRAMSVVEKQLAAAEKTALVVYAGVLARYDRMDVLSRLSQRVGRRDGIPGLWLLLPGDHQALLDGKAVPILSPGQRTRIPESWLQNVHRGKNGTVKQG